MPVGPAGEKQGTLRAFRRGDPAPLGGGIAMAWPSFPVSIFPLILPKRDSMPQIL